MHLKKTSIALLATLCLASGSVWADSIADLKNWLRETRTLKADFAQTSAGGIGGGKSQGNMAISRPGKFRWS
ncbi:MAG: outer-membrane lipoprotein carrier protein LolA, partial [Fluviibacter sp.]